MKQAFILKYRPKTISQLDLKAVREGLIKILKAGKIPHALFFAGPRGTGKTSAARILAKAINCEGKKGKSFEPCNRCSACTQINDGIALDLIEIDAASNRGIDDIRDLREKVKLAPTQLKSKVYIIDEVHMLTTEAFNALLKTLEEPPENTYFILCTTNPEKVPETIVSRCTRFNFKKGIPSEVVSSLKRVARGEKLKVEKGALEEIAKSVDGSFRDAHKILDQLTSGSKRITLKETKALLGKIEALSPSKLLKSLSERNLRAALLEIERIVQAGGDLSSYTKNLLERLRQGLLAKVGLSEGEEPKELDSLAPEEIQVILSLFSVAAVSLKTNPIPQLPLELAAVRWCAGRDQNSHQISGQKNQGGDNKKVSVKIASSSKGSSSSPACGLEEVKHKWQDLMACIRPMNHSVEALLRAARPLKVDGNKLILEVFYRFHKDRLEEPKCRDIFEEAFVQVFQKPIRLKCQLGERKNAIDPQSSKSNKTNGQEDTYMADQTQQNDLSGELDGDIINVAEGIFRN